MLTLVQIFPNTEHPNTEHPSTRPGTTSETLGGRHHLTHLTAAATGSNQKASRISMFFLCRLLKEANLNFLSHSLPLEDFPNNCFKWPKGNTSVAVLTIALIVLSCHRNIMCSTVTIATLGTTEFNGKWATLVKPKKPESGI